MATAEHDLTWMVGGPQGSGINVSADTFARTLSRGGLHVYANIEYQSNIMGKHSYFRIRASKERRRSYVTSVHILAAMDKETLFGDAYKEAFPNHEGHLSEIVSGGAVIYDAELGVPKDKFKRKDIKLIEIPYMKVLEAALADLGKGGQAARYQIMKNTVTLGATLGLIDYDFDFFSDVIKLEFEKKGKPAIGEMNVVVAKKAFDYVREHFGNDFDFKLSPVKGAPERLLINGTKATAIAKLKAGCAFQSYYPISPATDESVYLETNQREYQINIVQCEDEISCINMAVGAAHAGVRASTSTSGPGFALMAEGIGFASITEAPGPVVFLYQRGGPSTGLPTRQEQGDLRFSLHCAQGDFPHIVLASGDVKECFYDAFEAFNYAERYQMPVMVLLDKHLAQNLVTIEEHEFDMTKLRVDRGLLFDPAQYKDKRYYRYAFSESGISPRAVPGQEGGIFWATSDEHTPEGHITEGIALRTSMMEKRMGKLQLAAKEIPAERKFSLFGPQKADMTIISWGSNKGAILDVLDDLNKIGDRVNFLHVRLMRPFPALELKEILADVKRSVIVENNYSANLAGLIQEHMGYAIDSRIVKFDGRPFAFDSLKQAILDVMEKNKKEVKVAHG